MFYSKSRGYFYGDGIHAPDGAVPIDTRDLAQVNPTRLERVWKLAGAHGHWWAAAMSQALLADDPPDLTSISEEEVRALCDERGDRDWVGVGFAWEHLTATGRTWWRVLGDGTALLEVRRPSRELCELRGKLAKLREFRDRAARLAAEAADFGAVSDMLYGVYSQELAAADQAVESAWEDEFQPRRVALAELLVSTGEVATMQVDVEPKTGYMIRLRGVGDFVAEDEEVRQVVAERVEELAAVETRLSGEPGTAALSAVVAGANQQVTIRVEGAAELRHWEAMRLCLDAVGAEYTLPPDVGAALDVGRQVSLRSVHVGELLGAVGEHLGRAVPGVPKTPYDRLLTELHGVLQKYTLNGKQLLDAPAQWARDSLADVLTVAEAQAKAAREAVLAKRRLFVDRARDIQTHAGAPQPTVELARQRGGLRAPKKEPAGE